MNFFLILRASLRFPGRMSNQALETVVLNFQLLHPPDVAYFHAAVFALPTEKGTFTDTVLATNI